ncbi:MAG TPA: Grx4 family monothiol glutaredoxin [Polyangiaceae bacterium]|jgi:monothiol glutaredoxin|nr:Grx4 family monothiol glutaredoxin [Polyangiaceae bacterium]
MPLSERQRADFERVVRANDVVLFMKGNRRFPQCGFSATVVGILDKLTSTYETVNILEDPSVRDGMKEFSSWPTFPQLYVKGEFVGGCDIVKDMYASGELQKKLGVAETPVSAPRVTLSAAAVKAFTEAGSDVGSDVLRLEIDAAFNADLHFAPKADGDFEVQCAGVSLHVARASAGRADGISIDFVQAPSGMAFKIDNPNQPARVKPIHPKELKPMLDAKSIELFDVRPEDERAIASIAQSKPLDPKGMSYLLGLDKKTAVALHCHHGVRSRLAGEQLLREGFTNVYNLEGGIEAWSREVDPAVSRY